MRIHRFLPLVFATAFAPAQAHEHEHAHAGVLFTENKGQWPQQVLFQARTKGGALFVENNAFTYVVSKDEHFHASGVQPTTDHYTRHAYRMHFIGGRANGSKGVERAPHYVNYFLGNDESKWAGHCAVFGGVDLTTVYPGIDLHVEGGEGLKYDWRVAAGADASLIRLRFEGQDRIAVRDGMLYITTSVGDVIEQRPIAWSEVDGGRVPVKCEYVQRGDEVFYSMPDGYDHKHALVIDPTVVFGSYIGSVANNFGFTATYDNDGSLYGGGIAFGIGYPTTLGTFQTGFGGDVIDMGITKFSPDGSTLVWSTYIGGSLGNETPHSMVVNSNDELYIMGVSGASDFPTTTGCLDASFGAGPQINFVIGEGYTHLNGADAVMVHLSADASQLLGGTFIGGSEADGLNNSILLDFNYGDPFRGEIILDQAENPIMVTSTISTDMPVSANATQPTLGGAQDGYVCMLDPTMSTMLWGTYHGGTSDDSAFGIQQASDGSIYITGGTMSTDLPMAGTPYHPASSGQQDGYIAQFTSDGSAMTASTYLGTSAYDQSYFVQIDLAGFVYVVGQTHGAYPVSAGVYANPGSSQFIHKLSHDLSTSQWSTRIGSGIGTEDIAPSAFLVSDCGQIYFSGWGGTVNNFDQPNASSTIGLPVTPDALQSTTDGSDFYLMVLNIDAASLAYATFYGGTLSPEHVDGGTSRFDKDGVVYQAVCAGCWNNSDFPTTPGAWSNTNNAGVGACNLGVFKLDFEQTVQVTIDVDITAFGACLTDSVLFNAVGSAENWQWDLGDGTTSTDSIINHLYTAPGVYTVMLIGEITGLCSAIDTALIDVTVVAPADLQPHFDAVPSGNCDAMQVELFNLSTGSTFYIWDLGDNTTSTQTNPVHTYPSPGDYTVTLALIDPACLDTAYLSTVVSVEVPGIILDLVSPIALCDGASVTLDAGTGYDAYTWSSGQQVQVISVDQPGEYAVEVTDGFCTGVDTVTVLEPTVYASLADVHICPGGSAQLVVPFVPDTILWSTGEWSTTASITEEGFYWYVAEDQFGCYVTDTVEVTFEALATGKPVIPNVFTPNGDGKNERFLLTNVDNTDYSIDVFNRWGQKVFSTGTSGVGWNGELNNAGDRVPDGTYFVIVNYSSKCQNLGPTTVTGNVTLLR